ncbi:DUF2249 domain-containing protein [Hephaestia sp. GCM10023244]|uniref:DUF2249 domain-containing protein n=1 Tax=unclassified Hephaestia TaxID=2631281 RepID=UPI002076ED4F|nr:DUF2249 domain-containing protein [Hephaestia sp. MAHUQ-44]MCM8729788.1 DUF2249 domain-containing protein [Hephaestia sp. MAHUQ-44]
MTATFMDVDVRPILREGGEPFGEIMAAMNALAPGQGLRLLATFEPVPLFHVLGSKGFTHEARQIGDGDWEVLFSPAGTATEATPPTAVAPAHDAHAWPQPAREMDNRDLDPPEPMVRILAATEEMQSGEVLCALLCREPMFLLPELAKRGHSWRGAFEPDGTTYKILVHIDGAKDVQP